MPPEENKDAMKKIRLMSKQYEETKSRVDFFIRKRPTFMKELKISLEEYDRNGTILYDEEKVKQIHPDDQAMLRRFIEDMNLVFVLEYGISMIPDEMTRHIAEDTLLKRKRCKELENKYGIKECAIRRRKHDAIHFLSLLP